MIHNIWLIGISCNLIVYLEVLIYSFFVCSYLFVVGLFKTPKSPTYPTSIIYNIYFVLGMGILFVPIANFWGAAYTHKALHYYINRWLRTA